MARSDSGTHAGRSGIASPAGVADSSSAGDVKRGTHHIPHFPATHCVDDVPYAWNAPSAYTAPGSASSWSVPLGSRVQLSHPPGPGSGAGGFWGPGSGGRDPGAVSVVVVPLVPKGEGPSDGDAATSLIVASTQLTIIATITSCTSRRSSRIVISPSCRLPRPVRGARNPRRTGGAIGLHRFPDDRVTDVWRRSVADRYGAQRVCARRRPGGPCRGAPAARSAPGRRRSPRRAPRPRRAAVAAHAGGPGRRIRGRDHRHGGHRPQLPHRAAPGRTVARAAPPRVLERCGGLRPRGRDGGRAPPAGPGRG